jgi:hypothetical protein
MRALAACLFAMLVTVGVGACGAADADCDRACRNYFELHYWEEANAEIAVAPVEKREEMRKEKLVALEDRMSKGIMLCMKQCKTAATKEQVACLLDAKTTADAKKCLAE